MKELLKREDSAQSISFIDEITNDSLIGIMWPSGYRCIPVKDNLGNYIGVDKVDFEKGWETGSKVEYVKEAMSQTGAKTYLFESEYDLMKWCFINE